MDPQHWSEHQNICCVILGELCCDAAEDGADPVLPGAGEGSGGREAEGQVHRRAPRSDSFPPGPLVLSTPDPGSKNGVDPDPEFVEWTGSGCYS
jgi:hypothetical protein